MADQLYALQRDLDMVIEDVQNLKKSYKLLDYIAKVVRNCELEQMAQAAQMRRIEKAIASSTEKIEQVGEDLGQTNTHLDIMQHDLECTKDQIGIIDRNLKRITAHLGIPENE